MTSKATAEKAGMLLEAIKGLPESSVSELAALPPPKYNTVTYLMEKARGDRLKNGLPPLKRLTSRHRAILNMHLLGEKGVEIAAHFGIRKQQVYRFIHDPLGQEYLQMAAKMDEARFGALYGLAVDALKDGLDPETNISVRLRAASTYLERKDKLDDKHGKKADSAEDVIQRILEDPTIIQNLNLQVNNYGPPTLPQPKVIEQEKNDA